MSVNTILTEDIIKVKIKVMLRRIDRLHNICEMLLDEEASKEIGLLEIIKEQYNRMCEMLLDKESSKEESSVKITKEQYERYKEIEDIIIEQIAKIELDIDRYVYNTIQKYDEVIECSIEKIKQSEEYQDFVNVDNVLIKIKTLKEILRLYNPYIADEEIERLQGKISVFKFNALSRKQVEKLIYLSNEKSCTLLQYDNEKEKEIFMQCLIQKMDSLTFLEVDSVENDEVLRQEPKDILENSELFERLLIVEMQRRPSKYLNLLKAKIFNAHLCNIADNPFEREVYLTYDAAMHIRIL